MGVLQLAQLLLGQAAVVLAVQLSPLLPGHTVVCTQSEAWLAIIKFLAQHKTRQQQTNVEAMHLSNPPPKLFKKEGCTFMEGDVLLYQIILFLDFILVVVCRVFIHIIFLLLGILVLLIVVLSAHRSL